MLLNYIRIFGTVYATFGKEIGPHIVVSWVVRALGVFFAVVLVPVLKVWMIPMEISRKGSYK